MTASPAIAVIIAAYNARDTIGAAVASALAEPEVAEVIVVDDASSDDTCAKAAAAGRGDERLKILQQNHNQGPSAARNRAFAESSAPYVAVLDADDVFLPGRFAKILAADGWDFCADNIVFVKGRSIPPLESIERVSAGRECRIDFETFVLGNIADRRTHRGELGFLKPVMRREFLTAHGLLYDPRCRLGEDFLLYTEALAQGARFKLLEGCGYAALERESSLSGSHSIADLVALLHKTDHLIARLRLSTAEQHALKAHRRSVKEKIVHREVLEIRRVKGMVPALMALVSRPTAARDIFRDRVTPVAGGGTTARLLISEEAFTRMLQ